MLHSGHCFLRQKKFGIIGDFSRSGDAAEQHSQVVRYFADGRFLHDCFMTAGTCPYDVHSTWRQIVPPEAGIKRTEKQVKRASIESDFAFVWAGAKLFYCAQMRQPQPAFLIWNALEIDPLINGSIEVDFNTS